MEHHKDKDILKILTITARRVALDCRTPEFDDGEADMTQIPSFTSMLIRELYLKPKIPNT